MRRSGLSTGRSRGERGRDSRRASRGRAYRRREARRSEVVNLAGQRRRERRRKGPERPAARPRAGRGGPGGVRRRGFIGRRRLALAAAVVAVFGLLLVGRAAQLSVLESDRLQAMAAEEEVAPDDLQVRGEIYSADGRQLATSRDTVSVVATPYQVEDPATAARTLSETLGEEGPGERKVYESLTARDAEGELGGYSVVAEDLEPALAARVQELVIPGISTQPDYQRVYPNGDLSSQLLGYAGGYGSTYGGVESRYDEQLAAGEDVDLTLDTAVQEELETALREAVDEYDAKGALGLVMRVDDGSVVAMSNVPTFDNNDFSDAPAEVQRNRVLTDPFEPGSTFKAFTMAAALEAGEITADSSFLVPDSIRVADRVVNDSHPHETEQMTATEILEDSSNVGTIKIAQLLGGEELAEYITRFGFGEATGIDLGGEAAGSVPPYEEWSGASIGNLPIGQGLSTTPLQLAAGYAAIANGGYEVTPHVLEGEEGASAGERVITEETSAILRGMLQDVVDDGTGQRAAISGYSVAGKTGTAQKADPDGGGYGDKYTTSFIGFAPVSDPEYVTLVAVDEPQGSIWGEEVAAPAFQKVMNYTLGYSNIAPDMEPVADEEADEEGDS